MRTDTWVKMLSARSAWTRYGTEATFQWQSGCVLFRNWWYGNSLRCEERISGENEFASRSSQKVGGKNEDWKRCWSARKYKIEQGSKLTRAVEM